MSQTPPDPYGQQPYPYQPGVYPNPYQQGPQRPNNTTRNVLIWVSVGVVLFCGGAFALGWLAVTGVFKAAETSVHGENYPGSRRDPMTITEGQAFEIRDYHYAEGWSFVNDPAADSGIADLVVTNKRSSDQSSTYDPSLVFKFYKDDLTLLEIDCRATAAPDTGKKAVMDCDSFTNGVPADYDSVEVFDRAYRE